MSGDGGAGASDRETETLRARVAELERERDAGPTPEAYQAACKALWAHRERAERAETALREIAKRPDGDPAGYIARKALGTW